MVPNNLQVARSAGDDELAGMLAGFKSHGDFAELYDAAAPRVRQCLYYYCKSKAATDDAMQEVFVRIWQHADSFDPARGRALPWLLAIARNFAIDTARQRKRERTARAIQEPQEFTSPSPIWSKELALHMQLSLQGLSDSQQKLIYLAFVEDRTYRDIALLTNLPEGSVKSQIRRALIVLRSGLEQH